LETFAGLRHPEEGVVRLNSQEFQGDTFTQLRHTAYLVRPDDVACGTVFENLRIGQVSLTEERAWQALEKLRLRETVARLSEGLHTPLLGHGAPLSSGQIARLCLARAWLASPSLLLLDHALDDLALNDADFNGVLDIFLDKQAPWTVLLTSQDARVLTRCPSVLSLPEGVLS
jgi:ABC-type bacteriocin/lantibiotic exporter with double-glycine peptidase domain